VTEEEIDKLIEDTISLLEHWNKVFQLLMSKTRTPRVKEDLKAAIKSALKLHRKLGLPITPKAHFIEDHAFYQFCYFPFPLFYLIEEFVEVNHQIGHRKEEIVKRIKNDDTRAQAKAKQGCISQHSGVQNTIKAVHASVAKGPRGPYKKRKADEINTTPPPPAIRARPPAVTDQASDLTPALQEANKANNLETQENSWISNAPRHSPNR
jgi:hypothetical protein